MTSDNSPSPTHPDQHYKSDGFPVQAMIRPWIDPLVDPHGHDPRSAYVERYWLSVIGPTATWVMRRFADGFDDAPDGFMLDLDHTATTMGLSLKNGSASPFARAVHRCVMFGLAQPRSDGFVVRRRVPTIAHRHLKRLPDDVQAAHDDWLTRIENFDRDALERRLRSVGLPPAAVAHVAELAAIAA